MLSLATTWSAIRPQKRPLRKGRESNLEIQTSAMEVATTQAMDNLVAYTCIWAMYYKSLAWFKAIFGGIPLQSPPFGVTSAGWSL